MTTLYRPVPIEAAEQAEALPIGTVGHEPPHLYAYIKKARNYWRGTGDDAALTDYEMLPFTALVPIEAEEEWGAEMRICPDSDRTITGAARDKDNAIWQRDNNPHVATGRIMRQYRTPWEEAQ